MKSATIAEIKRELSNRNSKQLLDFCLRLAKYKIENKELLTYLLYESEDEAAYIRNAKEEIDLEFATVAKESLYFAKKNVKRILRMVNRWIKYSGQPSTEVELRIHYCQCLKDSGVEYKKSPVIVNLFQQQLKKIDKALASLPEDLRYDFHLALSQIK